MISALRPEILGLPNHLKLVTDFRLLFGDIRTRTLFWLVAPQVTGINSGLGV
jgi:hypothetical protein